MDEKPSLPRLDADDDPSREGETTSLTQVAQYLGIAKRDLIAVCHRWGWGAKVARYLGKP